MCSHNNIIMCGMINHTINVMHNPEKNTAFGQQSDIVCDHFHKRSEMAMATVSRSMSSSFAC